MAATDVPSPVSLTRRTATVGALSAGVLGLVLALAVESDLGLDSGLWYPVAYAGSPALTAPLAFARGRVDASTPALVAVSLWVLLSSVLALAGTVVLVLGFPPRGPTPWLLARAYPFLLYLAFVGPPTVAALTGARLGRFRAAAVLAFAPVGQLLAAALLIVLR